ncbi:MAG: tetratricopeptide repeat protein [Phycisphaerales bacterium]
MTPQRHQQIKELFLRACDLPVPEREPFLDRTCAADPDLRAAVLEHLHADLAPDPALHTPGDRAALDRLLDAERTRRDAEHDPIPRRIGRYQVIRLLGQGGMASVYEAQQDSPPRRVALKIIRPGLVSSRALRRIEIEAELLGRLVHPGIARIYDAGVAEIEGPAGLTTVQPFFAMELIEGDPLDAFADQHALSTRDRLALVARVCDALQHAHQRSVIHRDLKPANILVAAATDTRENEPCPKILDFGIARAADDSLHTRSLATDPGLAFGTLPYMSPEQLAGDPRSVDTRADIYAVGVILYQLLAGRLPFDAATTTLPETMRCIREVRPPRLGRIDPRFRGDIETIVDKSLEKDPARRYQSAAEFAADIRRCLNDEPIAARPPSTLYQLAKFTRRNRALVAASLAAVIILLAGAAVSASLAIRATRAEASAQRRLREAEQAQLLAQARSAEALTEAGKFQAVTTFLHDVLSRPDPVSASGSSEVTVREAMAYAVSRIDAGDLAQQPLIESIVLTTVGNVYRSLGDFEAAESLLRRAVDLARTAEPSGVNPDLAQALNKLGRICHERGKFADAEAHFAESLRLLTLLHGPAHEDVAKLHSNLGVAFILQGRFADAEPHLRTALDLRRRIFAPAHSEIATSANNLAVLLHAQGRFRDAVALFEQSLDMDRALRGPVHTNVATTLANLARSLALLGELERAEVLARESVEIKILTVGLDHPDVAVSLTTLGSILRDRAALDEARSTLDQALRIGTRFHGSTHFRVATTLHHQGLLLAESDQLEAAAETLARARDVRIAAEGPAHPEVLLSVTELARVRLRQGRAADAQALLDAGLLKVDPALPPTHWIIAAARAALGESLAALHRPGAAAQEFRAALPGLDAAFGPTHPRATRCRDMLRQVSPTAPAG